MHVHNHTYHENAWTFVNMLRRKIIVLSLSKQWKCSLEYNTRKYREDLKDVYIWYFCNKSKVQGIIYAFLQSYSSYSYYTWLWWQLHIKVELKVLYGLFHILSYNLYYSYFKIHLMLEIYTGRVLTQHTHASSTTTNKIW